MLHKLIAFKKSFVSALPENYSIGKAYYSLRCNMYSLEYIDIMLSQQNLQKDKVDEDDEYYDEDEKPIEQVYDVHDAD